MEKINKTLELSEVLNHRKDDCANYASCLQKASANMWPSFSCKNCAQYTMTGNQVTRFEQNASPLGWDL